MEVTINGVYMYVSIRRRSQVAFNETYWEEDLLSRFKKYILNRKGLYFIDDKCGWKYDFRNEVERAQVVWTHCEIEWWGYLKKDIWCKNEWWERKEKILVNL